MTNSLNPHYSEMKDSELIILFRELSRQVQCSRRLHRPSGTHSCMCDRGRAN